MPAMDRLQSALDFIERIGRKTETAALLDELGQVVGGFGFHSYVFATLPEPGAGLEGHLLGTPESQVWLEHYNANNYALHDPVIRRLRETSDPFVWRESFDPARIAAPARRMIDEAWDYGLRDGFCVPLFDLDGRRSLLSLATLAIDLSPAEKGVLHLVALYAQNRLRELLDGDPGGADDPPALTPRERECLQWTAAGKTSWEIAAILRLSQSTTDEYIAGATRKLGAANRTQAVAEGIRRGVIR